MRSCLMSIAVIAVVTLPFASKRSVADDHIEIGAGSPALGGAKLAVGLVHSVSSAVGMTATVEWSQRPWIRGEVGSIDRRLAYAGVGTRLRLFPHERIGNYVTAGVGVGRLTFHKSSMPGEWHAVPWTGLGIEAKIADRLYLGAEARVEWLRRRGSVEGELPLRIMVRVPLGRGDARALVGAPPNNELQRTRPAQATEPRR